MVPKPPRFLFPPVWARPRWAGPAPPGSSAPAPGHPFRSPPQGCVRTCPCVCAQSARLHTPQHACDHVFLGSGCGCVYPGTCLLPLNRLRSHRLRCWVLRPCLHNLLAMHASTPATRFWSLPARHWLVAFQRCPHCPGSVSHRGPLPSLSSALCPTPALRLWAGLRGFSSMAGFFFFFWFFFFSLLHLRVESERAERRDAGPVLPHRPEGWLGACSHRGAGAPSRPDSAHCAFFSWGFTGPQPRSLPRTPLAASGCRGCGV